MSAATGIFCLCGHSARDHGMTDHDAQTANKQRAACSMCRCEVYEWNPIGPDEDSADDTWLTTLEQELDGRDADGAFYEQFFKHKGDVDAAGA